MATRRLAQVFGDVRIGRLYSDLTASQNRGELILDRYCYPMVPYEGNDYSATGKKILYVGQATAGWDDDVSSQPGTLLSEAVEYDARFATLAGITDNYVQNEITPDFGGYGKVGKVTRETVRPFWQMVYELTLNILDGNSQFKKYGVATHNSYDSRRCFGAVSWTELLKISMNEKIARRRGSANPDQRMENFLMKNFNTTRDEIWCLAPTVVFFVTGSSWDYLLKATFPDVTFSAISADIPVAEIADLQSKCFPEKTMAIRTPHPRGWRNLEPLYDYFQSCGGA
jgi:hypothetical protein